MKFKIGIENNNEGRRSIAWALEYPGCFEYGADEQDAIQRVPNAIRDYAKWIAAREPVWIPMDGEIENVIEEVWEDYEIDENFNRVENGEYGVEAFFEYEWKPLTATDIERGLKMLAWSRADLLAVLEKLTPEQWAHKKADERWDIVGIISHIGGAEWWYMDRLGLAFPRAEVPKEPMERLRKQRDLLNVSLPALEGKHQVVGLDGEFWSPRKVLRRALWHERDHTNHIQKLLGQV